VVEGIFFLVRSLALRRILKCTHAHKSKVQILRWIKSCRILKLHNSISPLLNQVVWTCYEALTTSLFFCCWICLAGAVGHISGRSLILFVARLFGQSRFHWRSCLWILINCRSERRVVRRLRLCFAGIRYWQTERWSFGEWTTAMSASITASVSVALVLGRRMRLNSFSPVSYLHFEFYKWELIEMKCDDMSRISRTYYSRPQWVTVTGRKTIYAFILGDINIIIILFLFH